MLLCQGTKILHAMQHGQKKRRKFSLFFFLKETFFLHLNFKLPVGRHLYLFSHLFCKEPDNRVAACGEC